MTTAVCAFCGKSVLRAPLESEVEVREGEKLFHLDCYLPYKRQAPNKRQAPPSAPRVQTWHPARPPGAIAQVAAPG
jgi:hypothetical protein